MTLSFKDIKMTPLSAKQTLLNKLRLLLKLHGFDRQGHWVHYNVAQICQINAGWYIYNNGQIFGAVNLNLNQFSLSAL